MLCLGICDPDPGTLVGQCFCRAVSSQEWLCWIKRAPMPCPPHTRSVPSVLQCPAPPPLALSQGMMCLSQCHPGWAEAR